jgi:hypothetical protein
MQWKSAAGLLLLASLALRAGAQVKVGSETTMSLTGQVGAGYSAETGNQQFQSSHGLFFTGQAQLNGYYYNPKFINFNVQPFYNRNQSNGAFQSVLNDTGVEASVNLFSGSRVPGSVSYGKSWQTGSQFQIAGQPTLSSNGDTQTFAITWSAFVRNWPTLTATYSDSASSQTIIGETSTTDTSTRTFNLYSNYTFRGFLLNGFYTHQNFDTTFPAFLTGTPLQSTSSGNSYGASVSHALPWNGSIGLGASRFTYTSSDNINLNTNGTSDTANVGASITPTRRLTITANARYYDNLLAELQQNGVLPPGSVPVTPINSSISGVNVNSFASYNIGKGLVIVGYANEQNQHFQGETFTNTQWGATLTYNYARPLFGLLYFSFGTVDTTGNGNQGTVGFVGNLGLKKKINGWDINADVSYAQNVQSSIALFTTSNYNYGGYVRKRFGELTYWSGSYRGVQTGLTQIKGYNSRSDTVLTTLTRRWIGLSASYSKSDGTSILTSSGALVPTPVPTPVVLDQVVYNGTAYGVGVGLNPVPGMVINGNWFRVHNTTQSILPTSNSGLFSNNDSDRIYAQMQYNVRKLIFRAIYWHTNQLVSSSGNPRQINDTYSFSISRWFNFF